MVRLGGWAIAALCWLALPYASLTAQEFNVDAVHSTILFRVKHLNCSYAYGRFNEMTGKFLLSKAHPETSSIQVEVNMASIDTANTDRDKHLKGPDFFNVAQFPKASFKSTKITAKGEHQFLVEGELTMAGVTKPVHFTATLTGEGPSPIGDQRQGFEAEIMFKRSDFGLKYALQMLGDDVKLIVSFEGMRK